MQTCRLLYQIEISPKCDENGEYYTIFSSPTEPIEEWMKGEIKVEISRKPNNKCCRVDER